MITLKGLNFERSRSWLERAAASRAEDPVSAFISAWISYNHYYSTFALEYAGDFHTWRKAHFKGRFGDKAELLFLVQNQDFIEFLDEYKQLHLQRLSLPIELPVINMLKDSPVPENRTGAHELSALPYDDLFLVIYQIRNNLFHGSKDPTKIVRDLCLCTTAADFMVPLVASLLSSTEGEILNAYKDTGEARERIRRLAEA